MPEGALLARSGSGRIGGRIGGTDRGRSDGGFTLLEGAIALLIFSVGGLAVAGVVRAVAVQAEWASSETTLALVAQQEMERTIAAGFSAVPPGDATVIVDGRRYVVSRALVDVNGHTKELRVRVADPLGRDLTLITRLRLPGPSLLPP